MLILLGLAVGVGLAAFRLCLLSAALGTTLPLLPAAEVVEAPAPPMIPLLGLDRVAAPFAPGVGFATEAGLTCFFTACAGGGDG